MATRPAPTRRQVGRVTNDALDLLMERLRKAKHFGNLTRPGDGEFVDLSVTFDNGYRLEIGGMDAHPQYSVFKGDDELHEYDGHVPRHDAFPLPWTHATPENMLLWAMIRCDRVKSL